MADLLDSTGGEFQGAGEGFVQATIGGASVAAGVSLFAVRPLLLLRSRVLPPLVMLAGVALVIKDNSLCSLLGSYGLNPHDR
jgi:hypothetical protein